MINVKSDAANYALRGKVKDLCAIYPNYKAFDAALVRGNDMLEKKLPYESGMSKPEWSKPHYSFIAALDECGFGDLEVVFEYVIPGTSRRVDAVVFGQCYNNQVARKYALIVEFKSWENDEAQAPDAFKKWHDGGWKLGPDGILKAKDIKHPLFQALSYVNFLNNFHSVASASEWYMQSICYLPGVKDTRFLSNEEYFANPRSLEAFITDLCDECESYLIRDAAGLARVLGAESSGTPKKEEKQKHSRVTQNDSACDEFVKGTFSIPNKVCTTIMSACQRLSSITDTVVDNTKHAATLLQRACQSILCFGLDGDAKDKKWLVIIDADGMESSGFKNHAELAMTLQSAVFQTGLPFRTSVSIQTDGDALQKLGKTLIENEPIEDKEEDKKGTPKYVTAFNMNPLESPLVFRVYNAYKFESAVYTKVGIVDLCDKKRDQATDSGAFEAFLRNSTAASIIIALVDKDTLRAHEENKTTYFANKQTIEGFHVVELAFEQ